MQQQQRAAQLQGSPASEWGSVTLYMHGMVSCDRKARSLPSFPEGLVAAALRLGRHHLERRRVHHATVEAARVPRRRRGLHVARLRRRRLHVRLPRRRKRGRGRRRVRCLAERRKRHAVSSNRDRSRGGGRKKKQVSGSSSLRITVRTYLSRAPAAGCSSSSSALASVARSSVRRPGAREPKLVEVRGWVGRTRRCPCARVYI